MKKNGLSFEEPILIVEDDRKHAELLALYLTRDGFNTIAAYDGRQALELASTHRLLFAVLDVMLPDIEGWEICRRLRTFSNVPILITSGLGQPHDKVKGLRLGADDYMVKPFSFEELVARIKAILRRATMRPDSHRLSYGDLFLDLSKHELTRKGRHITLTSSEFRILEVLMAAPGRVYPRRELLACLYPSGGVVIERVIDVHVRQLRKKIEEEPSRPRYVLTSRGIGYRFADDIATAPANETLRLENQGGPIGEDNSGGENRV